MYNPHAYLARQSLYISYKPKVITYKSKSSHVTDCGVLAGLVACTTHAAAYITTPTCTLPPSVLTHRGWRGFTNPSPF
jgi:hypothetical protein